MKQTHLFTRVKKEAPKDEVSKNAKLLLRAGFIHKEMSGVYSFLPLGLRTLNKIIQIIREEMNFLGAEEVLLASLQEKELWEKTNRWSDDQVDVWFKTKLKNGTDLGMAVTHEEPMTRMMTQHISSYRDLPRLTYHFQTKMRNETRAKSGIMRMREFLMKDLYSFARTQEEHEKLYTAIREAYIIVFERVGLGQVTYPTFASGGIFSKYSEEFQTVSDAGEDIIYVDEQSGKALNVEVLNDEVLQDLGLKRENLKEKKSIEVGNIFNLGTRFSEPLGLTFRDDVGNMHPVIMGSYGIGPARVMGTIAEVLSDDKGLVWPESVAPFHVHLLSLDASSKAEEIYETLEKAHIDVLYDDRDISAGAKFAESDLIGIPYQIIVGKRSLESGMVEIKKRSDGSIQKVHFGDVVSFFQKGE